MSMREFAAWCAYVEDNGPLNYERRYDRPAALVAYVAQALMGGKQTVLDFLPYHVKTNELSDVDQQVLSAFGAKL